MALFRFLIVKRELWIEQVVEVFRGVFFLKGLSHPNSTPRALELLPTKSEQGSPFCCNWTGPPLHQLPHQVLDNSYSVLPSPSRTGLVKSGINTCIKHYSEPLQAPWKMLCFLNAFFEQASLWGWSKLLPMFDASCSENHRDLSWSYNHILATGECSDLHGSLRNNHVFVLKIWGTVTPRAVTTIHPFCRKQEWPQWQERGLGGPWSWNS